MSKLAHRLCLLLALLAIQASAHASFHLWTIMQLYSNADGSVQFVVLKSYAAGEQFLNGHTITVSQGGTNNSFTFPNDLPGNTAMTMEGGGYYGGGTSFKSITIGTQGFAALNVVKPDYIVPNGFFPTSGGTIVYGEGADRWTYPALPTDGTKALNRDGSTGTNLATNFSDASGSVSGTPAVTANTPGGLAGLWYNANESGWGIAFTQRRNVLFAAWFTYDAGGNPKWYVASSCNMPDGASGTSGTCNGSLFEVSGPTFFGTPFDPTMDKTVSVGTLQVNFADANNATMTYTVAGQTRTVPITRQPVAAGTTSLPVDYTDLWWNPNESGWGMTIAQQGGNMFLAWFVYDGSGKPTWYIASNCSITSNGCSGALFSTTGPAFGPTFDARQVKVTQAGTVSITFSDANTGMLSYTVNGVSASKAITRQLF